MKSILRLNLFNIRTTLKLMIIKKGRIQINSKPRRQALVRVPSNGDSHGWKEKYFLIDDAYVFGRDGPRGVPSSWRSIDTTNDRIHHQKELLSWRNVQGILSVPVEKRLSKVLLTPQSLARTSIWSSSIADLGVTEDAFVRKFELMGKVRTREVPPDVGDLYGEVDLEKLRAKRSKKSTARVTSTAGGSTDGVPPLSVPLPKNGGSTEVGRTGTVVLDSAPSVFTIGGYFELLEDVGKFHEGGLSREASLLVSQVIKGLHAAVLLSEDVDSWEKRYRELKEKNTKLEAEMGAQVKRATVAEEEKKEVERLLEEEKIVSRDLRDEVKDAMRVSVLTARRALMMEILQGGHTKWNPQEEIDTCNFLLGDDLGNGEGSGDVGSGVAAPAEVVD